MSDAAIALMENHARILSAIRGNEILISRCVKGNVRIKKIGNRSYYYLQNRDKDKIVSRYLGPVDSYDISSIEKEIVRRETMKQDNRRLRQEARDVERMLKAVGIRNVGKLSNTE
ncbi:MAG: hypothetical protein IKX74_03665 [Erysipelotrichaceae bacterium]|nr:hypothetical protein [Erysipelotrichaceae bacterium]